VIHKPNAVLSLFVDIIKDDDMRYVKVLAWIGVLAMGSILIYGFTVGDFTREGKDLLSMPWGIVSMVDLYIGFFLFSAWIIFREKSHLQAVIWVIFMMILGSFTASVYTLVALYQSKGDWKRFLMGHKLVAR
jgi:hypothetical protein